MGRASTVFDQVSVKNYAFNIRYQYVLFEIAIAVSFLEVSTLPSLA